MFQQFMMYSYQPPLFYLVLRTGRHTPLATLAPLLSLGGVESPFLFLIAISILVLPHASLTLWQSRVFTVFLVAELIAMYFITKVHPSSPRLSQKFSSKCCLYKCRLPQSLVLLPSVSLIGPPSIPYVPSIVVTPLTSQYNFEESQKSMVAALDALTELNKRKTMFIANTSHGPRIAFLASNVVEMRTPLTTIIGWADLLGRDLRKQFGSLPVFERLDTIKSAAETLIAIVTDILEVYKVEQIIVTLENVCSSVCQHNARSGVILGDQGPPAGSRHGSSAHSRRR